MATPDGQLHLQRLASCGADLDAGGRRDGPEARFRVTEE